MGIWRSYNHEENLQLLKDLTENLTRCCVYVEETYLGKLSEDLRLKVSLNYANYDTEPVTGINISIISIHHGEIDNYNFDFDRFWSGSYNTRTHNYWLTKDKGWNNKKPTNLQLLELNRAINSILSIYKEEYY